MADFSKDGTFLVGRNAIFLNGWKGYPTAVNNTWIDSKESFCIRNKTVPQREQTPRSCRSRNTVKISDSAIGRYLLDNPDCAKLYNDNMFQIIGRTQPSFHLAVLIYIKTKKPPLCRCSSFSLLDSSGNFSFGTRH